jgi:hypothetical protein
MMQIFHQKPKPLPQHRALIQRGNCWYDGWTGYEWFGCLTPHRYFGWQLHCWAQVYVAAFGDIRQAIFFARLEDALPVVDRLMNFADKNGHLSHEPVKYWPGGNFDWEKIRIVSIAGFEFISDTMVSDSRVPRSTPAHERRLRQRFPTNKPMTKTAKRYLEWRLSSPLPELYL